MKHYRARFYRPRCPQHDIEIVLFTAPTHAQAQRLFRRLCQERGVHTRQAA